MNTILLAALTCLFALMTFDTSAAEPRQEPTQEKGAAAPASPPQGET